ncbi:hypothetical protein COS54_03035 [Candidatus Shapirobacteria bacterium CG03_land_8_20_14_0_80_39_12]|uniref:Uncharacterized protein n=1 Tax=Candidatus Shapirobacteria bacterium CG03_land_8_20_14_0_80_39_12 TaxID=1974879 RepID=A0A2M7BBG1_9BACT|nr:MAG: hypothetical protein COS54_03035 [Candidatus Shapirobacteria bacterium CG03_land_8_20_14_0_80_39_12]
MAVEKIESLLSVPEGMPKVNPSEPMVIFLVQNGTGEKREITVTLSGWRSTARLTIEELRMIKQDRERVKERSRKKTTGTGKPYSSTEKRQIRSKIEKDREEIELAMKTNYQKRTALIRQSTWLLVSPPWSPLKVRINGESSSELITGEPLNEDEAAWRMFVLQEGKVLASHPYIKKVKSFFVLRREVSFSSKDKAKEAAAKLEEFRRQISPSVPDELVPVFRKISELNFSRPLLSELETLRREG